MDSRCLNDFKTLNKTNVLSTITLRTTYYQHYFHESILLLILQYPYYRREYIINIGGKDAEAKNILPHYSSVVDILVLTGGLWSDHLSQAARPGLALLMASAVVVLKHETSALRQRHNRHVREVTNPDKVGSGLMSARDATWGNIYRYCDLYIHSS